MPLAACCSLLAEDRNERIETLKFLRASALQLQSESHSLGSCCLAAKKVSKGCLLLIEVCGIIEPVWSCPRPCPRMSPGGDKIMAEHTWGCAGKCSVPREPRVKPPRGRVPLKSPHECPQEPGSGVHHSQGQYATVSQSKETLLTSSPPLTPSLGEAQLSNRSGAGRSRRRYRKTTLNSRPQLVQGTHFQ